MARKVTLFVLIVFFLLVGFRKTGPVLAQQAPAGQAYASQGEVLGVKESFMSFVGFLKDPVPNLAQWLIGRMVDGSGEAYESEGLMPLLMRGLITAFLGTAEEVYSNPNGGGGGGGGGGGFNYVPSFLPPGAILMPPGDWYFTGGMVGTTGKFIASIFASPPASGLYYAYDVLHRIGVAPTYAADGIGFTGLDPILRMWKAFRNVAYTIFALAMLVVGVMIMFRMKISPQAVLTLENALPRMIGVLVLITFSYAIAGFMIDLMYVIIGLAIAILKSSGVGGPLLINQSFALRVATQGGFLTVLVPMLAGVGAGGIVFAALGAIIGGIVGALGGPATSLVVGTLGGLVLTLVWLIIIVVLLIKLFIALTKTYINVILTIIFSPILIAVGIMPGSKAGFGSWLKTLTANLLVFPAIILIIILGTALTASPSIGRLWMPPTMGAPDFLSLGLSGVGASLFIKAVLAFGFLFILPSVPDIIRKAMGVEDSGIGAMIGQTLAPAQAIGKAGAGMGLGYGVERGRQKGIRILGQDKQTSGLGRGVDTIVDAIQKKLASR